jgi:hypothetical protein
VRPRVARRTLRKHHDGFRIVALRRKNKAIVVALLGLFLLAFFVPFLYGPYAFTCACPPKAMCTGRLPVLLPHYGSFTYTYLGLGGYYGNYGYPSVSEWEYQIRQDYC